MENRPYLYRDVARGDYGSARNSAEMIEMMRAEGSKARTPEEVYHFEYQVSYALGCKCFTRAKWEAANADEE